MGTDVRPRAKRQSGNSMAGQGAAVSMLSLLLNIGCCLGCLAGGYFCGKAAGRNEAFAMGLAGPGVAPVQPVVHYAAQQQAAGYPVQGQGQGPPALASSFAPTNFASPFAAQPDQEAPPPYSKVVSP